MIDLAFVNTWPSDLVLAPIYRKHAPMLSGRKATGKNPLEDSYERDFSPADVAGETLSVTFEGDVANDYTLWFAGSTGWVEMSTTKTAAEGGGVVLSWSQPGDIGNLRKTNFGVFQAFPQNSLPPQTGVQCDGVTLGAGPGLSGKMTIKWTYEDESLPVSYTHLRAHET